jgi:hypothetical protein
MEGLDRPGTAGAMPPVGLGWPAYQVRALMEYVKSNETLAPATPEAGGAG